MNLIEIITVDSGKGFYGQNENSSLSLSRDGFLLQPWEDTAQIQMQAACVVRIDCITN